jgi:hypothetical protein
LSTFLLWFSASSMPTLNSYSFHQVPGGQIQPSPQSLAAMGPVVQIRIEVPSALAASLVAANQLVPNPVDGVALIDTGATITSIHAAILVSMGINPVGVANVGTAGGPQQQSTYAARFSFPGTPLPGFELTQVIGCDLSGQTVLNQQPLLGLIGRDVLAMAVLVYNGSAGMFSLSF